MFFANKSYLLSHYPSLSSSDFCTQQSLFQSFARILETHFCTWSNKCFFFFRRSCSKTEVCHDKASDILWPVNRSPQRCCRKTKFDWILWKTCRMTEDAALYRGPWRYRNFCLGGWERRRLCHSLSDFCTTHTGWNTPCCSRSYPVQMCNFDTITGSSEVRIRRGCLWDRARRPLAISWGAHTLPQVKTASPNLEWTVSSDIVCNYLSIAWKSNFCLKTI